VSTRLKQVAVAFIAVFAVAQLVRPGHATPATDPTKSIQAQMAPASGLVAVLDRSCSDCHSNNAVWPWYTQVAPVSWVWASGLTKARNSLNLSEWAAYSPDQQQQLLVASCRDASTGKMPGAYTIVRPDARLSAQDIETICAASRQP
jgi:Haem-binding domain